MRRNKKKVIIIVAIIAIIVCILIVGAILFFTTDLFKSDQELFFKYLAQNLEVVEQYTEDPNKSAMDQIKSTPYIVNSNISFDLVSSNSEIANQTTPPRNFSVVFTQNVDPENNRDYSEAKIKYLTQELFTVQYAHDGDVYAINGINEITSSKILNVYLGIENNNLKQFAQNLGLQDISNIPDKIESVSLTDLLKLTSEEKEYVQNLLIKVINAQIPTSNYYQDKGVTIEIDTKQVKTNSYGVTLTSEEYKNLVIAIFNEVSQDETILNIILQKIMLIDPKTDITTNTISQQIQNQIAQINTDNFKDEITICVYESEGKMVRTQIQKNNIQYITIDHERGEGLIRTLISFNNTYGAENTNEFNTSVISATIKNIEFAKQISGSQSNMIGIVTYEQGDHIMKISIQNKTEQNALQDGFINNIIVIINDSDTTYFTIKANSDIAPTSSVSVQELNETNSVVLNNRTSENILQLFTAISTQLQKVYEQQMQVVQEVQEQENAQNGVTSGGSNAAEENTITNRIETVGE